MTPCDWPSLPLAQVCEINPRLPKEGRPAPDEPVSFVPMAAVNEIDGAIAAAQIRPYAEVCKGFTPFREGDVLFAKITPCMENGKVALAKDLVGRLGFGSTEFHVLRASVRVLAEWLRYFVWQPSFRMQAKRRMTGAAGQQRVPVEFLAAACLPVPPLSEQRRIVDILSRAEGIVRLRREAQKMASDLIPALFLDMFGDAAANPKRWRTLPIRSFVAQFQGGKNVQAGEKGASPYRILKVSAVTSGAYLEAESKPAPMGYTPPSSYIVQPGDLLFSRANTEALVGATALVESTNGTTLLPDKLWRFVWRRDILISPRYVCALLQQEKVRRMLSNLATGTSGSMKNISQQKLLDLTLPIAPHARQLAFEIQAEAVLSITAQQTVAGRKAKDIFDALLSHTFGPQANG